MAYMKMKLKVKYLWQKIVLSVYEPKYITTATIISYGFLLWLSTGLYPYIYHTSSPFIYWVPAVAMTTGALIGLPAAWIGGPKAARWEFVFMPLSVLGLLGGVVIEAGEDWTVDFAGHLLVALSGIVLTVVVLRWMYIKDRYFR